MQSAEVVSIKPNEIEDELKRLRAERDAVARKRAAREAAEAPHRELEAERIALANDQAIEDAESAIGPVGKKIAVVQTDLGVVIVKRPHAALFKRFQDRGKATSKEQGELVRPSLVYPELAAFETICEELPATLLRCANAVAELAGIRADEIAAKL